MASEGYDLGLEPYLYHNPVTGRRQVHLRERHDRTRSPRLERYRGCVGQAMEGREFRGRGGAEDEREVRAAFRQAAERCATADKARPGHRR